MASTNDLPIKIQVENGQITLVLDNGLEAGSYTLKNQFLGTLTHNESNVATSQVTITKATPTLKSFTVQTNPDTQLVTIRLELEAPNGLTINEGKVIFKADGRTMRHDADNPQIVTFGITDPATTLSMVNNVVSYDFILPERWAGKTVTFTAKYSGAKNYNIYDVPATEITFQ